MSDKHELNKTGVPALDRLMSTIDTEEKAMARSAALQGAIEKFNAGDPIPPVNATDLRQLWDASRRVHVEIGPPTPERAIGLAVYAAHGFEAASSPPEQLMAITWRGQLLSSLVERGVLSDYIRGEEPGERVFRAAAEMPFNKDDFFEAMMPEMLTQMPEEAVAKIKEDMQAQGYDMHKPNIDRKFLDWLRNNC